MSGVEAVRTNDELQEPHEAPLGRHLHEARLRPVPTILVVEDEAWVSDLLRDTLATPEWRVITVQTAAEAAEVLLSKPVALCIMDLHLPDGNGVDLCRKMKDDPAHANIPVLILTADHREETQESCLAAGAEEFLRKPFDPMQLIRLVDRFITSPSLIEQAS